MRIGLITDTHIPWEEKELPHQVIDTFQGVDLILHSGDIYSREVLENLARIAPVLAALGDDDNPGLDPRVQPKHILQFQGLTLWLVHERPYNLTSYWMAFFESNNASAEETKSTKPDIIVFGHEHRVVVERADKILYINSGSPTFLNYQKGLGTVGILELNQGKAEVDIIQLK